MRRVFFDESKNKVALLISTYNWSDALNLVLDSILEQTILPNEILIADDGSGHSTKYVIDSFRDKTSIPIKHFWHPDEGFRKTRILNTAISGTDCDYIIQVDGDIMLHPEFIFDHLQEAERGCYIKGSRVLLSESKTKSLIKGKAPLEVFILDPNVRNKINAMRIPFLAPLFIKKNQKCDKFKGCNCAFWREDFIAVNGYNNEMNGWGHEDIELAARFVNYGLVQKQVKMKAVCYHLHHPLNSREHDEKNFTKYASIVQDGAWYCKNGYKQLVLKVSSY